MATDYAGATRFVAAESWSRGTVPIRGITIHMAEGGGTVSWLTRVDGNSSHYVVEYDGDVVQMVRESQAAGSMNPKLTRTTDDPAYTSFQGESVKMGRTALNYILGGYATNPNAAVIAIEVEGFAAQGPNTAQRKALVRLIRDIRSRRGALGVLGHRDQQSYKACPGKKIPWKDYGGHAKKTLTTDLYGTEAPTVAIKGSSVPETPTKITLKPDTVDPKKSRWLYVYSDHRADAGNKQLSPNRPLFLTRFVDADTYAVAYEPPTADSNDTSVEYFVKSADIAKTEPWTPTVDLTPFDQADIDAAVAAKDAIIAQQKTALAASEAKLAQANAALADKKAKGLQVEQLGAQIKA